jgi:hypothetical protein
MNASECARMHLTVGPHKLTQEKPSADSRPNMDGYGLDGLWACHKACQCSTHVPLHAIQVFIGLLSVPFLFDCVISRLDAGPSNYVARTVCGAARPSTKPSTRSWAGCSSTVVCIRVCIRMHENACICIQGCTNAYECIRMHANAYECTRMHTTASAYTSECVCE